MTCDLKEIFRGSSKSLTSSQRSQRGQSWGNVTRQERTFMWNCGHNETIFRRGGLGSRRDPTTLREIHHLSLTNSLFFQPPFLQVPMLFPAFLPINPHEVTAASRGPCEGFSHHICPFSRRWGSPCTRQIHLEPNKKVDVYPSGVLLGEK